MKVLSFLSFFFSSLCLNISVRLAPESAASSSQSAYSACLSPSSQALRVGERPDSVSGPLRFDNKQLHSAQQATNEYMGACRGRESRIPEKFLSFKTAKCGE